uniref:Secreted protein n=1 Tax=Anguilla anguilla TaxID=7936 RepID=A0A0E9WSL8_ANGAN
MYKIAIYQVLTKLYFVASCICTHCVTDEGKAVHVLERCILYIHLHKLIRGRAAFCKLYKVILHFKCGQIRKRDWTV